MRLISDLIENFSAQDCTIRSFTGLASGLLASRFFEPISMKGGAFTGAIFGATTSTGCALAGPDANKSRIIIATIFSLATATLVLRAISKPLSTRLGFVIPTSSHTLLSFTGFSILGQAITFYLPILLPKLRLKPVLPTTLKEIYEISSERIKEFHDYYTANRQAFAVLPSAAQYGLKRRFEKESLTLIDGETPLTSQAIDSWTDEDIRYINECFWSFEDPELETALQKRRFALDLNPPETIPATLPLPIRADTLTNNQKLWYQAFFQQYPDKWQELSPAFQWELLQLPEFADTDKVVSMPTTVTQVQNLPLDAIRFFYENFDPSSHLETITIAFIKRFAEQNLSLSIEMNRHLTSLPNINGNTAVVALQAYEVQLYACLFSLNPARWNNLSLETQWAFMQQSNQQWPRLNTPQTPEEVAKLPIPMLQYFYRNFIFLDIVTLIRNQFIQRFFEQSYAINGQIRPHLIELTKHQDHPLGIQFNDVAQIAELSDAQVSWFATIYRDNRPAWMKLPIACQLTFRNRDSKNFPTLSYPISVEEVESLSEDVVRALHASFDSLGYYKVAKWMYFSVKQMVSAQRDDQPIEFSNLPTVERANILQALIKRFFNLRLSVPRNYTKAVDHIDAPKNIAEIKGFTQEHLLWYIAYYRENLAEWQNLPLNHQWAFKSRDNSTFPDLYVNAEHQLQARSHPADEAICYLANNTNLFAGSNWVGWSRQVQHDLKAQFERLGIQHDLPCHPVNPVVINDFSHSMIKFYAKNFQPRHFSTHYFSPTQQVAIFRAFLNRFDFFGHSLQQILAPFIERAVSLSQDDAKWVYEAIKHCTENDCTDPWDSIPCSLQIALQTKFQISAHHFVDAPYSAPTIDEVPKLSEEAIGRLHNQYSRTHLKTWYHLPFEIQQALNKRFKEEKLPICTTHNKVNAAKVRTLSENEKRAYHAVFVANTDRWKSFNYATQTAFHAAFGAIGLSRDEIPLIKDYGYERFAFNNAQRAKRVASFCGTIFERTQQAVPLVKSFATDKIWPAINKNKATQIGSGATLATAVVLETTGYMNFVPDCILTTGLSLTGITLEGIWQFGGWGLRQVGLIS